MDPRVLNLRVGGGEWSASRPDRFTTEERGLGTHCTGGWVGPRAGLDKVAKIKKILPLPRNEPPSSSSYLSRHYT